MNKSHEPAMLDIKRRDARLALEDAVYYVRCQGWPGKGDGILFYITDCKTGSVAYEGAPLTMTEVWRSNLDPRVKWICKGLEGIREEWTRE